MSGTTPISLHVYNVSIVSVLLYGSETWASTEMLVRKIDAFDSQCLQIIDHVRWVAEACHKLWNMGSKMAAAGTWIDHQMPSTLVWTPHALPTNTPDPCLYCSVLTGGNQVVHHILIGMTSSETIQMNLRQDPNKLEHTMCDCGWWRFLLASLGSMPNGMS